MLGAWVYWDVVGAGVYLASEEDVFVLNALGVGVYLDGGGWGRGALSWLVRCATVTSCDTRDSRDAGGAPADGESAWVEGRLAVLSFVCVFFTLLPLSVHVYMYACMYECTCLLVPLPHGHTHLSPVTLLATACRRRRASF